MAFTNVLCGLSLNLLDVVPLRRKTGTKSMFLSALYCDLQCRSMVLGKLN